MLIIRNWLAYIYYKFPQNGDFPRMMNDFGYCTNVMPKLILLLEELPIYNKYLYRITYIIKLYNHLYYELWMNE